MTNPHNHNHNFQTTSITNLTTLVFSLTLHNQTTPSPTRIFIYLYAFWIWWEGVLARQPRSVRVSLRMIWIKVHCTISLLFTLSSNGNMLISLFFLHYPLKKRRNSFWVNCICGTILTLTQIWSVPIFPNKIAYPSSVPWLIVSYSKAHQILDDPQFEAMSHVLDVNKTHTWKSKNSTALHFK